MQGVVGAGGVSGVASKPFAAKAASKAYKTDQHGVPVLMGLDELVLVRGDELRQLVAILDAPQHGDEIGVLVIEYLAGKALHLALHGAGPAK